MGPGWAQGRGAAPRRARALRWPPGVAVAVAGPGLALAVSRGCPGVSAAFGGVPRGGRGPAAEAARWLAGAGAEV